MPLPVALPSVSFDFITQDVEKRLDALAAAGAIVASIYNDAQSADGDYYFQIVDGGRGPIRPVNAKALHWIDAATGKDVYAMYVKGVPPRHILANAVSVVRGRVIPGNFTSLSRESIAAFVNAVAQQAMEEMQDRTPVVTGKLKSSYRIVPAEVEEHG